MDNLSTISLKLTPSERVNPIWIKISNMLKERLAKARVTNDRKLSIEDTNVLRGRIAELKSLISIEQENPEVETYEV